jgi:hypothetical protein
MRGFGLWAAYSRGICSGDFLSFFDHVSWPPARTVLAGQDLFVLDLVKIYISSWHGAMCMGSLEIGVWELICQLQVAPWVRYIISC